MYNCSNPFFFIRILKPHLFLLHSIWLYYTQVDKQIILNVNSVSSLFNLEILKFGIQNQIVLVLSLTKCKHRNFILIEWNFVLMAAVLAFIMTLLPFIFYFFLI